MALAAACSQRGLTVGLLDPNPERRWVATYGMWPELPADLPVSAVAARAAGRAIALTEHRLGWEYVVLDVDALRAHLVDRSAGVTVYAGRAVGSPARGVVALADGSTLRASVVVDATGRSRPLDPNRTRRVSAEQTAYGMILDEASLAPLVAPGEALFMDWRGDHGEPGWPTFLYVVPLGGGRMLAEETSLARRPGLPLATMRRRLDARLAHHGISVPKDARTEKVSFPVDQIRHSGRDVLGFGAAAPLIHPATGFSVAAALQLAPQVAGALAEHLPADPDRALAAAGRRSGPPPRRGFTGFDASAWRRCCACRPVKSPASSNSSSRCQTRTAGRTSPAATTSAAPSRQWRACFGNRTGECADILCCRHSCARWKPTMSFQPCQSAPTDNGRCQKVMPAITSPHDGDW
ncbi:lycopene cyclase family protein [Mycolicibacterium aichiense]|uniref:lycopene cyclase family protein n=1 Tax=Mycolicibacterium aichiense TaxID=1799 RepID=UPI001E64580E|nr:lycopene cyclase family protein [Mycolicibacterium aichiense]